MRYHFLPPPRCPETHRRGQTSKQSPLLCTQAIRDQKHNEGSKHPSHLRGAMASQTQKRNVISRPPKCPARPSRGKKPEKEYEKRLLLETHSLFSGKPALIDGTLPFPWTSHKLKSDSGLEEQNPALIKRDNYRWRKEQRSKEVVSCSVKILKNWETDKALPACFSPWD